MNAVLLAEAVTVMQTFTDSQHNVTIADPPYGIGESSKNHKSRNTPVKQSNGTILKPPPNDYGNEDWDNQTPKPIFFSEIKRISANQIIFGANYFKEIVGTPFKPPRRTEYDNFLKQHPTGWIVWDKCNGDNDFNDCELIYTTYNFPSYVYYLLWNGMIQAKSLQEPTTQQGNKQLNEKRIHPTHKPVLIYLYLLQKFQPIYSVFDPCVGGVVSA